jgi:hypothetical protein
MTMAARRVDPPNVPAPRPSAPQTASAVSSVKPNPGNAANVVNRSPAKKPGANETSTTRDAKRTGEPQAPGASIPRVVRPPKRTGGDGSGARDGWTETSLRNVLFDFTAPAGGPPLFRSAEMVARLRKLLAMLPSLGGDIGALAASVLGHEIACHSALLERSHQRVVR